LTTRRDRHRKGTPQWIRLGELLAARRVELDPAYFDRGVFARVRDINLKLTQDIENNARENFTPLTLRDKIAPAYGVEFASIQDVLNGDGDLAALPGSPPHKPPRSLRAEPRPLAVVPPPGDGGDLPGRGKDLFPRMPAEAKAEAEPHYREIEGRIFARAAAEAERRGIDIDAAMDEVPAGAEVFPDQPRERAWWDGAREQGLPSGAYGALQLAQLVAVLRVREAHAGNGEGNAGTGLAAR
jgi:hypothetical protein